MDKRGTFGSKLAIILTTAGSAVGLGNIWRFPFMTGQNGGAAFILIYLGCVFILGIPGMISEFIVGRYSQSNAARAYGNLGFKNARYIGYLGILTSTIILGFYAVVAGWCLQYLFASISGKLIGDTNYIIEYFKTFSSDPIQPCLWGVGFVLITHYVVAKGVNDGIERASKLLMPLLLILLIILVVASCLLPGASKGIDFLLKPDFTKVSSDVFLEALGQAFFSLSLGTACLCTYASYFKKDSNILKSATQIALLDSFIAILAGLMIFPAAFSVGVQPDSGPSLIFITLPNVFRQAFETMPIVGFIISILFYALLVFAALTSTISMHEIGTAFFHEELHLPRNKAAWILTTVCGLIAVFCSLSVGAYSQLQLFGMSLMDFCDFLTAQFMLPAGAFLTSILVGWFVEKQLIANEFTNNGTLKDTFLKAYIFSVKFIVPLCILLIFLHQFHII
jgi:NSS family neurotransmitter:Na+ symporter